MSNISLVPGACLGKASSGFQPFIVGIGVGGFGLSTSMPKTSVRSDRACPVPEPTLPGRDGVNLIWGSDHANPELPAAAALAFSVMTGCASLDQGTAMLDKYPGVQQQITSYYDANATEEGWDCDAVTLYNITQVKVIREFRHSSYLAFTTSSFRRLVVVGGTRVKVSVPGLYVLPVRRWLRPPEHDRCAAGQRLRARAAACLFRICSEHSQFFTPALTIGAWVIALEGRVSRTIRMEPVECGSAELDHLGEVMGRLRR